MKNKVDWRKYLSNKKLLLDMNYQCKKISNLYITVISIFIAIQLYFLIVSYYIEKNNISFNLVILFLFPVAVGLACMIIVYYQIDVIIIDVREHKGNVSQYILLHRRMWFNITMIIYSTSLFVTLLGSVSSRILLITIIFVYLLVLLMLINIILGIVKTKYQLKEIILAIQED